MFGKDVEKLLKELAEEAAKHGADVKVTEISKGKKKCSKKDCDCEDCTCGDKCKCMSSKDIAKKLNDGMSLAELSNEMTVNELLMVQNRTFFDIKEALETLAAAYINVHREELDLD